MHGMNPGNAKTAHLARAAMEGVTLGMAYGLRRMEQLGVKPREIRLTGGGSKSPVWRQVCSDVFGCPVVALPTSEGAALGAAVQALAAAGGLSVADLVGRLVPVDEATRLEPRREFDYRALLERQDKLRDAVFADS